MAAQVLSPPADHGMAPFTYQAPNQAALADLLLPLDTSTASLPDGFPAKVQSTLTWTGDEVNGSQGEWVLQLTPDEVAAVEQALKAFIDSKAPMPELGPATFPLPDSLVQKLDKVSQVCYQGCGFCILRGLESQNRSEHELAILFAGVSAHIAANRGFQDVDRKHVLSHLYKKHARQPNEYIPPSFNDAPVAFHTDDGDIVALYYASIMKQGGRTLLASQSTVYNELAAKRPDLVNTLADNWVIDTYHAKPDAVPRNMPLLHRHQDGVTMQFSRLPFSRWQGSKAAKPDVPALTDAQKDALNAIESIAAANSFTVPTAQGDILFFNNLGLFHARERYVDTGALDRAPEKMDRLVLRLWLQDPKRTAPVAPALTPIWDAVYGPNSADGRKETWNLEAKGTFAMNRDRNG